jgi:hypothetical protein
MRGLYLFCGVLVCLFVCTGMVSGFEFNPEGEVVSLVVGDDHTFSVSGNTNESVSWYVDGVDKGVSGNSFVFKSDGSGIFSVRVDVIGEMNADSHLWSVVVQSDADDVLVEKEYIKWTTILLYTILAILVIVIFFVIRLLLDKKRNLVEKRGVEKNKFGKKDNVFEKKFGKKDKIVKKKKMDFY